MFEKEEGSVVTIKQMGIYDMGDEQKSPHIHTKGADLLERGKVLHTVVRVDEELLELRDERETRVGGGALVLERLERQLGHVGEVLVAGDGRPLAGLGETVLHVGGATRHPPPGSTRAGGARAQSPGSAQAR